MSELIPVERIYQKIYIIRGEKVMLDRDLAGLYGVETKYLKRQVKRNIDRFPSEFMFQLTNQEFSDLRCQIGTSSWGGSRYIPMVFTEYGIVMLSSILKSPRAVRVNIQIVKAFIRLRRIIISNEKLRKKIEDMERKYDRKFKVVFDVLKQLMKPDMAKVKKIGF